MSMNALIVLSVVEKNRSVSEVAREFDVSRTWVYELLRRYRIAGMAGLEPGSKRPLTNPHSIPVEIHAHIAELRFTLNAQGLDAGAATIQSHLQNHHGHAPALSTIWRSLRTQGLVEPTPKKKPKMYLQRFEAHQPNETWQSDFTHIRLANGRDIEVLNFLDDHSRLLLRCQAYPRVTCSLVVDTFMSAVNEYGPPQSTLTDNGLVFTTRLRNGRNAFEYLLDHLGIQQKNSSPNHPQTQGKIERFHQTLKKWLHAQAAATNITELQAQLDTFQHIYNHQRPHRAINGQTPHAAYTNRPKATPQNNTIEGRTRTRTDRIDPVGKVSLRRAGKQHHLGIGRAHASKSVFLIIDAKTVTVTDQKTGEILSEHTIEPTKSYWPKNRQTN